MTKNIAPVVDPAICPLCGNSNACQMCNVPSAAAQVQAPCWCVDAEFPPGLLDRLPESAKGKACICANCVAQARKAATTERRS